MCQVKRPVQLADVWCAGPLSRHRRGGFMAWRNPHHVVAGAMNAGSLRSRTSFVAVLVAVLLLMQAACGTGAGHKAVPPRSSASIQVNPEKAASLRLRNGFRLEVPAGAVTRAGRLTVTAGAAPSSAPPPSLELAGPVYELRLHGADLRSPVKISIPVPLSQQKGIDAGPDAVVLAYYDSAAGQWRWRAATYDRANRTLSADIPHLSDWAAMKLIPQQVLDAIHGALLGFLGVANSPRPDCPGSSLLASSGVHVTADTGDLVAWCPDVTRSGVVLRIVSNRTYALEADYKSDWSATLAGPVDPVTSAILREIPALSLRAGGPGVHTSIIPGGAELDVKPQPGTSARVLIAPSAEGIFIDALTYAATTLAMVYSRLPGAATATAVKTGEVIGEMFTDGGCVEELRAAYQNPDVSTSQAAGELFRGLTDVAAACLAKYWPRVYQASGPGVAFITSVLLWAADGIKLTVTDLHALVDTAFNPLGAHLDVRSLPLPEFYYADAVLPEVIYISPAYPKKLAIDNQDWVSIQSLDTWSPESMIMTGILHQTSALRPAVTFQVRVVATDPRTCALQKYQLGSTLPAQAYVYGNISVSARSGNPPSYLVGDSVFKVCR